MIEKKGPVFLANTENVKQALKHWGNAVMGKQSRTGWGNEV